MKLIFSKNFDDFDDYKEIEVDEENFNPLSIGRIINYEQQNGWILAINEYSIGEKVFLLACKNEFTISGIQERLDNIQDELVQLKNNIK